MLHPGAEAPGPGAGRWRPGRARPVGEGGDGTAPRPAGVAGASRRRPGRSPARPGGEGRGAQARHRAQRRRRRQARAHAQGLQRGPRPDVRPGIRSHGPFSVRGWEFQGASVCSRAALRPTRCPSPQSRAAPGRRGEARSSTPPRRARERAGSEERAPAAWSRAGGDARPGAGSAARGGDAAPAGSPGRRRSARPDLQGCTVARAEVGGGGGAASGPRCLAVPGDGRVGWDERALPSPRRGPGMPCDPDSSAVPPPRDRSAMSARRDPRPTAHLSFPDIQTGPTLLPKPTSRHAEGCARGSGTPYADATLGPRPSSALPPAGPGEGLRARGSPLPLGRRRGGGPGRGRRCLCTERSRSATASRRRHRCWRQGCVSARGMRRDGVRGAWTWRAGVSPVPATINAAQCTPLDAPARPPWTVPCQDAAAEVHHDLAPRPGRPAWRPAAQRARRVQHRPVRAGACRGAPGRGREAGDSLRRLLKFVVARTGGRRMAGTLSPRGRSQGLGDAVGWSILDVWVLRCA